MVTEFSLTTCQRSNEKCMFYEFLMTLHSRMSVDISRSEWCGPFTLTNLTEKIQFCSSSLSAWLNVSKTLLKGSVTTQKSTLTERFYQFCSDYIHTALKPIVQLIWNSVERYEQLISYLQWITLWTISVRRNAFPLYSFYNNNNAGPKATGFLHSYSSAIHKKIYSILCQHCHKPWNHNQFVFFKVLRFYDYR